MIFSLWLYFDKWVKVDIFFLKIVWCVYLVLGVIICIRIKVLKNVWIVFKRRGFWIFLKEINF